MLGQRLPAETFTATTALTLATATTGARAGLVVLGESYAWAGLRHDGDQLVLVCRTAAVGGSETDTATAVPLGRDKASVRLRVTVRAGAVCQFSTELDGRGFTPIGQPFTASAGKWIGATLGLFATAPPTSAPTGAAEFDWFRVGPQG